MDQEETTTNDDLAYGIVEEELTNAMFKVKLDDTEDEVILAYLAGRMRRFRIRVLVGDKVGMVTDPYGGKARITKRL